MRYLKIPFFFLVFCNPTLVKAVVTTDSTATLRIIFKNTANHKKITTRDSIYVTSAGEKYTINKLKYYISNIQLGEKIFNNPENFQLISEPANTSFSIPVKPGNYTQICFLLGIDSLYNCSGAQEGVLDPMNDMFWTWNSGYVMFKLEGSSESSTADKNRIEHHLGGYRYNQNIATPITLLFTDPLHLKNGEQKELTIILDLDQYWNSKNKILITEKPVCTLPGQLAKTIAANFSYMFSIENVH